MKHCTNFRSAAIGHFCEKQQWQFSYHLYSCSITIMTGVTGASYSRDPPASPVFLEMDGVHWNHNRCFLWHSLATKTPTVGYRLEPSQKMALGMLFRQATVGNGNGPLVSLIERSDISGNRFLFQFGTNTGNVFNTILAPNTICLPLRCADFTIATLEMLALNDAPLGSPSLLPISFNESSYV